MSFSPKRRTGSRTAPYPVIVPHYGIDRTSCSDCALEPRYSLGSVAMTSILLSASANGRYRANKAFRPSMGLALEIAVDPLGEVS